MAFSKNPAVSTYQTKGVPLASEFNPRGSVPTTDATYTNCYLEMTKNKTTGEQTIALRKRNGSSVLVAFPGINIRGWHFWEDRSKLYVAVDRNIYIYAMPAGTLETTITDVYPTAATTGEVGFTEFLYDDGSVKLVTTDGTTLSTIDTAGNGVACVDADMPVHLPQVVYLDGYIFVVKVDSADLHNSDLNNPLSWEAAGYISSELIPDRATYVAKLNNYILLLGNKSVEYFWDVANEAPDSPLQRNDTPLKQTGLVGGLVNWTNKIIFVGDNNDTQPDVFLLEDFKIESLGTEFIRRALAASSTTLKAGVLSMDGRDFYILNNGTYTFVLDLETKLWHLWNWGGSGFDFSKGMTIRAGSSVQSLFILTSNANCYKFDASLYQDVSTAITTTWQSGNQQFDTYDQKVLYRFVVVADRGAGSNAITLSWSDDDFQTFSTPISIELNQERPSLYRLGRFRRRAFKITHTANMPLRIKELVVDLNMGQA
jgi:hypothetical protein